MLENLEVLEKDGIYDRVKKLKDEGYRLVTMTCERAGDSLEIIYHFDLNYSMRNLKATVEKDANLKSISTLFPGAFLIENEIQDLFGLTFEGLTIDYKGKLYMVPDGPQKPMA